MMPSEPFAPSKDRPIVQKHRHIRPWRVRRERAFGNAGQDVSSIGSPISGVTAIYAIS
jgi:hypothetical protein